MGVHRVLSLCVYSSLSLSLSHLIYHFQEIHSNHPLHGKGSSWNKLDLERILHHLIAKGYDDNDDDDGLYRARRSASLKRPQDSVRGTGVRTVRLHEPPAGGTSGQVASHRTDAGDGLPRGRCRTSTSPLSSPAVSCFAIILIFHGVAYLLVLFLTTFCQSKTALAAEQATSQLTPLQQQLYRILNEVRRKVLLSLCLSLSLSASVSPALIRPFLCLVLYSLR